MLTTLASKVIASFILDMFIGKHCLTQILSPFLMMGATFRRICNSITSIVGVTRGMSWMRIKCVQPNATTSH
jgi:hypothetical protein